MFLIVGAPLELTVEGGTLPSDLDRLRDAVGAAVAFAAVDVIRTWMQWRRADGMALRRAIRSAIADGRLPPGADPESWTYPLVMQQRAMLRAPWALGSATVIVIGFAAVSYAERHLHPVVLTALGVELIALLVSFLLALRGRTGRRAQVLSEFLAELDARPSSIPPAGGSTPIGAA